MSTRTHPRPPGNPLRYENRGSRDYDNRQSNEYPQRNSGGSGGYQMQQPQQPLQYDNTPQQQFHAHNNSSHHTHHRSSSQPREYNANAAPAPTYNNRPNGNSRSNNDKYQTQPTRMSRFRRRPGPDSDHQRSGRKHRKHTSALTQHFVAAVGEFMGTIVFLWFAFAWHQSAATQTDGAALNGGPSATTIVYVSIAYGFSLLVSAWCFYRISGGLFNPAVVVGMVLAGTLPFWRGVWLIPAEILGAMVAAALVSCMLPGDISAVNTLLNPSTSIVRGLFIEMFLTFLLMFAILMLAAEKTKVTFMAPLGIGLALFVCELAGILYTGASLNPARSFGPAVASLDFPGYHWIYWLGPFLGAILAAGYYRFNKLLHYEEANPGQDSANGQYVSDGEEA